MFTHIMMPIDLDHKDRLAHAIDVAADQAKHYNTGITFVSVTGGIQGEATYSTEQYGKLLRDFAGEVSMATDIKIDARVYDVPDPAVEMDGTLLKAISDTDADLVVVGSHQPGWMEYIFNSHGGRLASHAPVSVMVVRDPG